jgi:hypothetical protein
LLRFKITENMNSQPILLLQECFGDIAPLELDDATLDWEFIRAYLMTVIQAMLIRYPEQLAQAMYRIDVDEEQFKNALYAQDVEAMADLVIRRTLQKLETRKKFSNLG